MIGGLLKSRIAPAQTDSAHPAALRAHAGAFARVAAPGGSHEQIVFGAGDRCPAHRKRSGEVDCMLRSLVLKASELGDGRSHHEAAARDPHHFRTRIAISEHRTSASRTRYGCAAGCSDAGNEESGEGEVRDSPTVHVQS